MDIYREETRHSSVCSQGFLESNLNTIPDFIPKLFVSAFFETVGEHRLIMFRTYS